MKGWTMLIRLLKIQFPTVFDLPFRKKGKQKTAGNPITKIILLVFTLFLCFVSFMYSYGIGNVLKSIGKIEMLPELAVAIASVAMFFTTIYKVGGVLFGFKDFDFLLSLPLKFSTVVAGRLLLLYLINLPAAIIIMIPTGISYSLIAGWDIIALLFNFAGVLLLPLVPVTLAAIIGVLTAFLASRFRSSKIISIILIFIILLVFMAIPYMGGAGSLNTLTKLYPLAILYRRAVWGKEITAIVLYLLISALSLGIFLELIARRFVALNNALNRKNINRKVKALKIQTGSAFYALYTKEMKRYFSSVNYVVNTGFGMVLLTVFSLALLVLPADVLQKFFKIPDAVGMIRQFLPELMAFCVATTCISASSISLEGKNLWIMKSLPVSYKMILGSKIAVNLIMILPLVIIDAFMLAVRFDLKPLETLCLLIVGISMGFYISISGLFFNLLLPKLDWSSEITVVKQSMAVLATMFTGIAAAMLPTVVRALLPSVNGTVAPLMGAGILAVLSVIFSLNIMKNGRKQFQNL
ncbi:hypothetical protein [Anaerocolumna chitinilytica]|uniref:Uncharacterized protein n=1 Tax=Anaerocolumna chitinilytica TaxID=1727145 RepID=A0A7I8DPR2_9FIRM|nr:hypothetical protein [Anaerocolumna chitinilytica]BCK00421.1 hypothetical protein bsdcttw_34610 [Anaerocolumna chitinilytica]